MAKIISYTALHYGAAYLAWALRSVIDHVDEAWILYSPRGSHGTRAAQQCPETREQLYAIADYAAGDKLRWVDGDWRYENQQREAIHGLCPDADVILVLDSDEVWHEALAQVHIGYYKNCVEHFCMPAHRFLRLPIIHYWRSFYRCVRHDPAYPVRVIYPKVGVGEATMQPSDYHSWGWLGTPCINHMGYAQPSSIVKYKMAIHGHKAELRTDIDWYQDRWLANAKQDCHPVGSEWWNPEPVDPWACMPDFMKEHPFAGLEVIP